MIRLRAPKTRNEWVAVLAGMAFATVSGLALARGLLSLTWPKVNATITHSDTKNTRRTYGIDIRYQYAAGGGTHEGTRYRFQSWMSQLRGRDQSLLLARYPVGEHVMVAVNPSDNSDAVLLPGLDLESIFWFGVGLVLLFGGVAELRTQEPAPAVVTTGSERAAPRYRAAKVLSVIGAAALIYGGRNAYQGWSSLRWPSVDGHILYSRARTAGTYETLLWYEYYIANHRYVAGKYRTGGNVTPFKDVAIAAAKRYPAGRAVKVYYNPSQPAEALLEPGMWYGNFILPGIGIGLLALALLAKKYSEAMARQQPG